MLTVYALPIDRALCEAGFESLLVLCGEETAAAIRRLVRRDDRLRGLWSALLTRSLICRDLGIPNAALRFDRGERGKPFLRDRPTYQFYTAHAGDWVVAITDDQPVGIDIEEIRPLDLAIAHSYFSHAEAAALEAQPVPEQLGYFFSLWVLKESYLKATGEGLHRDLSTFTVTLSGEAAGLQVPPGEVPRYLREYDVAAGYRAGACATHGRFPQEVRHLEGSEVLAALGSG